MTTPWFENLPFVTLEFSTGFWAGGVFISTKPAWAVLTGGGLQVRGNNWAFKNGNDIQSNSKLQRGGTWQTNPCRQGRNKILRDGGTRKCWGGTPSVRYNKKCREQHWFLELPGRHSCFLDAKRLKFGNLLQKALTFQEEPPNTNGFKNCRRALEIFFAQNKRRKGT